MSKSDPAVELSGCAAVAQSVQVVAAADSGRALRDEACDAWLELPEEIPPSRHVAIRVAGDSMLPVLKPGDIILVKLDATPSNGDLVVARLDGDGYVVKRFERCDNGDIELVSFNAAYAPRKGDHRRITVLGTVIARFGFALALAKLEVVEPQVARAMSDIARETLRHDWRATFVHAIYAGWLIALMVWMLPGAETAKWIIIVMMTYVIGIGGFAHIIAGVIEVFYAALRHEATWQAVIFGFGLPTLAGNVLGGTTLVAALNHAQATSGE